MHWWFRFGLTSLVLVSSCDSKDEDEDVWCNRLVANACACEAADTESDLCQDAESVASNDDEDTCEDYYYANVPEECRASDDYSGDGWGGSGSGSSSGSSSGSDSVDSDGDGLTDDEEIALGLDPNNADTDGDGYTDGAEDNSYTNPLDPEDHPYEGGWPIDSCRNDITPTGSFTVGEIVQNYTFTDQFGEEIRLHDFCNHVVLLEHAGFG